MSRGLLSLALLAALFGGWCLRAQLVVPPRLAAADPYAALDDAESAYRLRLIELTLAAGHAPRSDTFLAGGAPPAVPFTPLVHAALARVAMLALDAEADARELGGVDERELEAFAREVSPLLGLLAIGAAFAVSAWLATGSRRNLAGVVAATWLAFAPSAVAREVAASLSPQPWIEILSLAQLAALAFALRAREQVDVTLGALLAGACAGFALLAGPEAWPLPVAALAVLIALALRERGPRARDGWRTAILFGVVTASIVIVSDAGRGLSRVWPEFARARGFGLSLPAVSVLTLSSAAAAAMGCVELFRRRRGAFDALLLAVSFFSFACALFDERFLACANVAFAVTLARVTADAAPRRARMALLASLIVVPAAALWSRAAASADAAESRAAFVGGLRWLREHSPSPGPFNHADAYQEWRVLSAPELAGSIAQHARRPTIASPWAGDDARTRAALDALGSRSLDELTAALGALGAAYLVVTPRMLADPRLTARSADGTSLDIALARLALVAQGAAADVAPGLELVYASVLRERVGARDGPVISIWRRAAPSDPRQPPSVGR